MSLALIGYTGFVGSNLAAEHDFDDLYNSSNIHEIDGKSYDLIVSAGVRADKWRINQEPDKDRAEIDGLIEHFKTVTAKQFVLISTVDVYKNPIDVDEDTPIEVDSLHAYGANRYYLERFCREQFNATIIRLPALFGKGLKKNIIFDLLHDNNVDRIHHAGAFQYYNLNYLWKDIQTTLDNDLKLVNFTAEPVRTDEIAKVCFGMEFTDQPAGSKAGLYDMHSKYAKLFGGQGFYMYSKQQELADIKRFVENEETGL